MGNLLQELLIIYIYPLEIAAELKGIKDREGFMQCAGHKKETNERLPIRRAALTARKLVNKLLKENALTVLFTIT